MRVTSHSEGIPSIVVKVEGILITGIEVTLGRETFPPEDLHLNSSKTKECAQVDFIQIIVTNVDHLVGEVVAQCAQITI